MYDGVACLEGDSKAIFKATMAKSAEPGFGDDLQNQINLRHNMGVATFVYVPSSAFQMRRGLDLRFSYTALPVTCHHTCKYDLNLCSMQAHLCISSSWPCGRHTRRHRLDRVHLLLCFTPSGTGNSQNCIDLRHVRSASYSSHELDCHFWFL